MTSVGVVVRNIDRNYSRVFVLTRMSDCKTLSYEHRPTLNHELQHAYHSAMPCGADHSQHNNECGHDEGSGVDEVDDAGQPARPALDGAFDHRVHLVVNTERTATSRRRYPTRPDTNLLITVVYRLYISVSLALLDQKRLITIGAR